MRRNEIETELSRYAFDFFYWFSRFEFALKENGYLKSRNSGDRAEPGWDKFVGKWAEIYRPSDEAHTLLDAKPEQQIVAANSELTWKPVDLSDRKSELAKVVRLLLTVRNNLFHGGKHGGAGWDDAKRTQLLLVAGIAILHQLAKMASLESDFEQYY